MSRPSSWRAQPRSLWAWTRLGLEGDDALAAGDGGRVVLVGGMGVRQVLPHLGVVGGQLDRSAEAGEGLGQLAVVLQGKAEIGVDSGVAQIGRQTKRFGISAVSKGPPVQVAVGVPEIVVSGRQIGLQAHGLLAMLQGLLGPARIDEGLAEVGAGQGQGRIESDGRSKGLEGLLGPAQITQYGAQVVPGQGELGSCIEGRTILLGGLLMAAQGLKGQTQIIGRLGIPGPQTQGGATTIDRPFVVAQAAVSLGQVGVECGGVRSQGRGPADQLDGPTGVAALMMHDAEKVKGFGVLRLASQQVMVATGRIRVAAGLVQSQGGGQVLRIHGGDPSRRRHGHSLTPRLRESVQSWRGASGRATIPTPASGRPPRRAKSCGRAVSTSWQPPS